MPRPLGKTPELTAAKSSRTAVKFPPDPQSRKEKRDETFRHEKVQIIRTWTSKQETALFPKTTNRKRRDDASDTSTLLLWKAEQQQPNRHLPPLDSAPPPSALPPPEQIKTKAFFLSADFQTMPGGSRRLISPIPRRLYPSVQECLKGRHWKLGERESGRAAGERGRGVANIWPVGGRAQRERAQKVRKGTKWEELRAFQQVTVDRAEGRRSFSIAV